MTVDKDQHKVISNTTPISNIFREEHAFWDMTVDFSYVIQFLCTFLMITMMSA
jgi:hypothetical protein